MFGDSSLEGADEMKELIEELNLNAWPALHTVMYDGWVLRFTEGYTKRSNSITPLYTSRLNDVDAKISECESIYERSGLPPVFKITPFDYSGKLDLQLEKRGYLSVDTTLVMSRNLHGCEELKVFPETAPSSSITVESKVSTSWLHHLYQFNSLKKEYMDTAFRVLQASPLRQGFFTLYDDGEPAACGLCVLQAGYMGIYDIVTDPARRRRGHATHLMRDMLIWGQAGGAAHAYLMVVENNDAAREMYFKFGFEQLYKYWYRVKS